MKHYLSQALLSLRPGSEFSYLDNDYSTVEWHVLEGTAPTQLEINAEIVNIKEQEESQKTSNENAKAALLERLGITAEEAKLLLS